MRIIDNIYEIVRIRSRINKSRRRLSGAIFSKRKRAWAKHILDKLNNNERRQRIVNGSISISANIKDRIKIYIRSKWTER
jgi:hypothetical protein